MMERMNSEIITQLSEFPIHPEAARYRDAEAVEALGASESGIDSRCIGASREGQPIMGFRFGSGPRNVSITAGCHADEPIGPMTAQALYWHLSESFQKLLELFSFHVVPTINPDGARRNSTWFSDPLEMHTYLNHVIRELPGDDIEFGFGDDGDERPENVAAMKFFRESGPYAAHFSLHGLAIADGAWCLICKEWQDRAESYMSDFTELCGLTGFGQHDIDRKGEKGFHRIRKGYTTTPHSEPMKQFFLDKGDEATAAKFKPTSMQFIQSLGGDPLCIVSELPLFRIGRKSTSLEVSSTNQFRDRLDEVRARKPNITERDLTDACDAFQVQPSPIDIQIRLQTGMIVLALHQVLAAE